MLVVLVMFSQSATLLMLSGLIQLGYVVPLVIHFRKKGQVNAAAGLIVSAAVFLLLTVACAGMMR